MQHRIRAAALVVSVFPEALRDQFWRDLLAGSSVTYLGQKSSDSRLL